MKNITVSLEEELYRRSRIAAAEADTTVTALVREFLTLLTQSPSSESSRRDRQDEVLAVIETIRARHPAFQTDELLSRDELHARS